MTAAPPTAAPTPPHRASGFTLFELLAVLIIAAIFIGMALPNLQNFIALQRVNNAATAFLHAISLTRSTAITRGMRTHLAPKDGLDWRSGWRIFIKAGNSSERNFETNDILIAEQAPLSDTLSITSSARTTVIVYQENGTGSGASWIFSQGPEQRMITINFLGRVRSCSLNRDDSCRLPRSLVTSAQ